MSSQAAPFAFRADPPSGFAPYRRPARRMPWIVRLVLTWDARHRTRRHLAALPEPLLHDAGLTCEMALAEAAKPFWTA
ncbi:Uncharacterized conserved protein YjiS, DUF1127 family [Tranquillimonas rosea]|uniref:Uncharacterized conserved protein YjiS, DUF1127 family n=1 Tax=Tranquillimonas rosea TaxID=641238 RepID=A0A1H9PBB2_9RHOB|nr:DUF1127 domain-containing protein [Tranquillimonas rosea]SER45534.1 Uncharacterized conserved protein YjiS, DUF1127 family [Tranquillimonas rosea]